MAVLGDFARLIRSKNAGPFMLTFDVMFSDEKTYEKILKLKVLTKEVFCKIYNVSKEDVLFFEHKDARAIKISIPRPYVQCDKNDGDVYGGQQHAPLVEIEVPE